MIAVDAGPGRAQSWMCLDDVSKIVALWRSNMTRQEDVLESLLVLNEEGRRERDQVLVLSRVLDLKTYG